MKIFAFRHGQTDWNKEGRIQGHLDVPLNEFGREEARRLAWALKRIPMDLLVSSDLSRAQETAKIGLEEAVQRGWHVPVPLLTDPRFREVHLGALQGLTHSEILARHGAELSERIGRKILSDEDLRGLGSESVDSILERIQSALSEIAENNGENSAPRAIAICTHGGIIRRLLHVAAEIDEIRFSIPNSTLFPFEFERQNRKLRFLGFNPI